MGSHADGPSESDNVKLLLKGIIDELRSIGAQLSQQGRQIEELQKPNVNLDVLKTESVCALVSPEYQTYDIILTNI
jgi:hypothetical protein